MKSRMTFLAALAAAVLATTASAGTYRWVDKDGNAHYSDSPVAGSQAVTVKAPGVTDATPPPAGTAATDPAATAAQDQVAVKAQQCDQSRKRLANYKNSGSLFEQDEYGRKREITGDERVSLIVKTQRDVKDFCGETTVDNRPR